MDDSVDVAIIGSGINSLVAAAELALDGKRVCIIERSDRLGGFIHSAERTLPGFIHDSFSSWHPLFVSGGAYAALGQGAACQGPGVLQHLRPGDGERCRGSGHGSPPRGHRAAGSGRRRLPRSRILATRPPIWPCWMILGRNAGTVFGAFGAELRSFKEVAKIAFGAVRRGRFSGTEAFVRDSVMSGRNYVRSRFDGWEADQLWSPWLLHAGLGPDQATGGVMLPVMAMSMHSFGLPVVKGGASRFVAAFESLLRDNGVRIMLGAEAEEILVDSAVRSGRSTRRPHLAGRGYRRHGAGERFPASPLHPAPSPATCRGCRGRRTVPERPRRHADPPRLGQARGVARSQAQRRSAGAHQQRFGQHRNCLRPGRSRPPAQRTHGGGGPAVRPGSVPGSGGQGHAVAAAAGSSVRSRGRRCRRTVR